ncbi:hypothetical protein [Pseudarthrobacter sulfonivorans]|uniref:hypothetical protein n=1 Tax=Pseudarthrobacter sulfonivorans TaxID=121292 RepID=UPI0027D7CEF8|nr:hypothetical protein [Pseudarthrobacter sulfonivorans]
MDIGSLRALESGYFRLKEVVVVSLIGVLRFESIDLAGLGPELGLKYFPVPMAGPGFGL